MPPRKLARIEPTDDWPYLQLQFEWPEQEEYEVVRPVVLFGFTPAERAQQTGISASTIYRKATRFEQLGIRGFLEPEPEAPDSKRLLPQAIRRAIVQLKAEYPAFRPNELATICEVRFKRRPSSHTIKKILATEPAPLDVHQLGGGNIYCISILENYSRAIMASAISRSQATPAFLSVLFAAIARYGVPERLVSDGGSVFKATHVKAIYAALGIQHTRIDPGQAWQSYIETHFNVQRRMADWDFSQAQTWSELKDAHKKWMTDYSYQDHWAHLKRADRRRSPADVLGWATGRRVEADELRRIFAVRSQRRVDQQGYVRFRNWRIYSERGLGGRPAVVWLYEDHLTLEFADETLSEYTVAYQRDRHHLRSIDNSRLYETRFVPPQLPLLELDREGWRLVIELPQHRRQQRLPSNLIQGSLFALGEIGRG